MQHVMPHERPTEEELGPIGHQRYALPAVIWAICLVLILVGGWLDVMDSTDAIHTVEARLAASPPATPH